METNENKDVSAVVHTEPEELGLSINPIPNIPKDAELTDKQMKPLNEREKKFVKEYMKDGVATQAAIRAGYAEVSAGHMGGFLLDRENVKYMIKWMFAKNLERTKVSQDKVLNELAKLAFMNIGDLDLKGKTISDMSMDDLACIAQLTRTYTTDGDTIETIKFHDKLSALDKLGKHLKLFSEKSEPDTQIILNVTDAPDDIPRPPKKEDNSTLPLDREDRKEDPEDPEDSNDLPDYEDYEPE